MNFKPIDFCQLVSLGKVLGFLPLVGPDGLSLLDLFPLLLSSSGLILAEVHTDLLPLMRLDLKELKFATSISALKQTR